jgi:Cu-processing system ATP-binding protein
VKLSLEHVSVRFGQVLAADDVSLQVEPGTTNVLVGPNGAGKSTLLGVLLGLVRPSTGKLTVDGVSTDLSRRTTPFRVRRRLGYLPESVAFSESLTGRQVLRFFARARGVPGKRVDQALERVGLDKAGRRAVRGYSRGMRQRLGLAIATLADSELLVLDEPTGGLDQQGLSLLWELLDEWRAQGRIALLSSHDLTLIERSSDKIVVMNAGRVLAEGTPVQLRELVDLPVTVRFVLDDAAMASSLAARLRESFNPEGIVHQGLDVAAVVRQAQLLPVMRTVNGELPHVVTTRVEEPGLDQVYERLLREAS